ncbi:hypothetical protein GTO10_05090, partial [Candidatus Saccharibacteria bacterium]|nr:hypothetical protein [Candidatus Saccharibacteria bacterium]
VEKVKPRIFECPGVLSEKQAEFYNSFEFELLYGGAAGGGKSEILLKTAISEMLLYRKNRGILLRESYPELERSLIMRA